MGVWGLLWTVAWAGSPTPAEMVTSLKAANPAAESVIACSQYGWLQDLAGPLGGMGSGSSPLHVRLASQVGALGGAEGVGVDAKGAVGWTVSSSGNTEVRLPFRGSSDDAMRLAQALDPAASASADGWTLTVDGKPTALRIAGEALWFTQGVPSETRAKPALPLIEGLGATSGCLIAGLPAPKAGAKEPPFTDLALWIPDVGGGAGAIRMSMKKPLPPVFSVTSAAIPVGNLPVAPDAVITLSAPLGDLIAGVATADAPMAPLMSQLSTVAKLPDGLSVAIVGNPNKGGEWVGMTRVVDLDGKPFPAKPLVKQMVKALEDSGSEVTRVDKTTFMMPAKDRSVYVRAAKGGQLAFGGAAETLDKAFDESGLPWLDAAALERARKGTIAMDLRSKTGSGLWLVTHDRGGALELETQLVMTAEERAAMKGWAAMMGPMLAGAMQKFGEAGKSLPSAPVVSPPQ